MGVSAGVRMACVCGDVVVDSHGSSVLCGASGDDTLVPGPF